MLYNTVNLKDNSSPDCYSQINPRPSPTIAEFEERVLCLVNISLALKGSKEIKLFGTILTTIKCPLVGLLLEEQGVKNCRVTFILMHN